MAAANRAASDWSVSIQNKLLMPDPHTETGSQDVVVISATESLVSLHDVTALRFLLRQPSPNWKSFNVEEIAVRYSLFTCKFSTFSTILLCFDELFCGYFFRMDDEINIFTFFRYSEIP